MVSYFGEGSPIHCLKRGLSQTVRNHFPTSGRRVFRVFVSKSPNKICQHFPPQKGHRKHPQTGPLQKKNNNISREPKYLQNIGVKNIGVKCSAKKNTGGPDLHPIDHRSPTSSGQRPYHAVSHRAPTKAWYNLVGEKKEVQSSIWMFGVI